MRVGNLCGIGVPAVAVLGVGCYLGVGPCTEMWNGRNISVFRRTFVTDNIGLEFVSEVSENLSFVPSP